MIYAKTCHCERVFECGNPLVQPGTQVGGGEATKQLGDFQRSDKMLEINVVMKYLIFFSQQVNLQLFMSLTAPFRIEPAQVARKSAKLIFFICLLEENEKAAFSKTVSRFWKILLPGVLTLRPLRLGGKMAFLTGILLKSQIPGESPCSYP
jgi:hypothetical protein